MIVYNEYLRRLIFNLKNTLNKGLSNLEINKSLQKTRRPTIK